MRLIGTGAYRDHTHLSIGARLVRPLDAIPKLIPGQPDRKIADSCHSQYWKKNISVRNRFFINISDRNKQTEETFRTWWNNCAKTNFDRFLGYSGKCGFWSRYILAVLSDQNNCTQQPMPDHSAASTPDQQDALRQAASNFSLRQISTGRDWQLQIRIYHKNSL